MNEIVKAEPRDLTKAVEGNRFFDGIRQAWSAWFGPLTPHPQQAPVGTEPRQFDYPAGINLSYSPRATEQVGFDQLRQLADAYYLLRAVIETRKDQITKIGWRFSLKDEETDRSDVDSDEDTRVQKLTEFFRYPDRTHNWQAWLRMVMEDLLVIDAATIYPWRTNGKELFALVPVDGATIKPILSPMGTTPLPPDKAYQQIIKGMVLENLTSDELVYAPRNPRTNRIYGYSPVEQIILIVNLGIRRSIHQINFYTEGNIPDALVSVPENWSMEQIKQFQQWFDAALAGELAARRRVTFIPKTDKVQFTKELSLKDEMDEYLARVVCFAFSLPPTAFVRQVNRATAQQANETALKEGLEPLKLWVKDLIDGIVQKPALFNLPDVEFVWEDEPEIDPVKQAQIDDIYIRNGKTGVDEVRERDGQDAIGVGPAVYTAQGTVPLIPDVERKQQEEKDAALVQQRLSTPAAPGGAGENGNQPEKGQDGADAPAKFAKTVAKKKRLRIETRALPADMEGRKDKLAERLAKFLAKQGKKVARKLSAAYAAVAKADEGDDVERILDALLFDEWTSLAPEFEAAIEDVVHELARSVLLDVGIHDQGIFDVVNRDAVKFAEERAAELVGMRYVDGELVPNPNAEWAITDTTRKGLRDLITQALDEGLSPTQLADRIEASALFSAARAQMIARTELARAHVEAALIAGRRSGLAVRKYSLLSSIHDLDDECDFNADAGRIDVAEMFPSGDDGPPFHPNCVCAIEFEFVGEEVTP